MRQLSEPSRTRLWNALRGPRYIDLPIRAVALLVGVFGMLPSGSDRGDSTYLLLVTVSSILIIAAPYFPRTIVLISVSLGCVLILGYPSLINTFPAPAAFGLAVLASQFHWKTYALGSALLFGSVGLGALLGTVDSSGSGIADAGFIWLVAALLGLSAGLLENRIRAEIARRVEISRANEEALARMRMRFTLDTHDTISHTLSTEAAIIKMLVRDPLPLASNRKIAELALVNSDAQKRLRTLLTQLRSGAVEIRPVDLRRAVRGLSSSISAACSAGGLNLGVYDTGLPRSACPQVADHALRIMMEMVTNIIRYALPAGGAELRVEMNPTAPGRADLTFDTTNSGAVPLQQAPRSLDQRAGALGGRCTAVSDPDGVIHVRVTFPVRIIRSDEYESSDDHVSLDHEEECRCTGGPGRRAVRPGTVGSRPSGGDTDDG